VDDKLQNLLLILFSVFLSSLGQIVLKLGAIKSLPQEGLAQYLNVYNIAGLGLYGFSAIAWMLVLRKVELSYAYPMVALGYVLVVVASYFFFGETINSNRLIGLALIIGGILFISRS
jgi:multidrug transporter EmrE-like cation transporter